MPSWTLRGKIAYVITSSCLSKLKYWTLVLYAMQLILFFWVKCNVYIYMYESRCSKRNHIDFVYKYKHWNKIIRDYVMMLINGL